MKMNSRPSRLASLILVGWLVSVSVHPASGLALIRHFGDVLLAAAGGVTAVAVFRSGVVPRLEGLLAILTLPSYYALRFGLGGSAEAVASAVTAGMVGSIFYCWQSMFPAGGQRVLRWFGWVVIGVSTFMVRWPDDPRARFGGISGNPNRLSAIVLLCSAYCLTGAEHRRRSMALVQFGVWILLGGRLLIAAGSAQSIAACVVLLVGLARTYGGQLGGERTGRRLLVASAVVGLGFLGIWNSMQNTVQKFEEESSGEFSGRTELFGSAWREFSSSPLFGGGELRFTVDSLGRPRASHNLFLGLIGYGGVVGLVLLLGLGLYLARALRESGSQADLTTVMVLLVLGLVQNLEFVPVVWALLGISLAGTSRVRLADRPSGCATSLSGRAGYWSQRPLL